MKTLSLTFVLAICSIAQIFAQNSGDYRSNSSAMNWSTGSAWETFNGTQWIQATTSPANSDGIVTIMQGHTVSINNSIVADEIVIENGGTLVVDASNTLMLSNGSGDEITVMEGGRLSNYGTIDQSGSLRVIRVYGIYSSETGSTVTGDASNENIFENGSELQHNFISGGRIINATWQTGSLCTVKGLGSNPLVPSGLNQSFYNFSWDLQNLSVTSNGYFDLSGLPNSIANNYSIQSTGTAGISLNTGAGNVSLSTGGTFAIANGSKVILQKNVNDNTTLSTHHFSLTGSSSLLDFAQTGSSSIEVSGNFTTTSGTIQKTSSSSCGFTFTGNSIILSGATISSAIDYTINPGAVISLPGENYLGGSGNFAASSAATLRLGSASSSGVIQNNTSAGNIRVPSGNRTFAAGVTIVLAGTALQYTGDGFPADVNIEIDNSENAALSGDLTIGSTTALNLVGGRLILNSKKLTINGDLQGISEARCFTGDDNAEMIINRNNQLTSGLYFDQAAAQQSNNLLNLTITTGATVDLATKLYISGDLNIVSGTFNTGNKLVLASDENGTARLFPLISGAAISGQTEVQRYIPPIGRRWRFLACPILASDQLQVRNAWQNNTHITGGSGGSGPVGQGNYNPDGFDWTASNASSFFKYNESKAGNLTFNERWESIAGTTGTNYMEAGTGYRVFIRGDRSDINRLNGNNNEQNPVTLSATGTLATGDQMISLSCSNGCTSIDGWHLTGNPFPSPYDFNAQYDAADGFTQVSNTIYGWDAQSNSYVSFNALSNAGSLTGGIIPSGSAIWLRATGPAAIFTFREQYKYTGSQQPAALFKSGNTSELHLRFIQDSLSYDKLIIKYAESSMKGYDAYDIRKISNPYINFSSKNPGDTNALALTVRPETASADTILLSMNADKEGNYKLEFNNAESFPESRSLFLHDDHKSAIINAKTNKAYDLSIVKNAASWGDSRLALFVMAHENVNTISRAWLENTGTMHCRIELTSAQAGGKLLFEKSSGDGAFIKADEKNIVNAISYDLEDKGSASILYRLTYTDKHGKAAVLPLLKASGIAGGIAGHDIMTDLKLFPVPATNSIHIEGEADIRIISIYQVNGMLVYEKNDPAKKQTIEISTWDNGIYFARITDRHGYNKTIKFVKQ